MVGGEVQAEIVNHIQHYRESPLVQKAISDMKTLLEKRQASKVLEERPSTRQSVREALKNRKKAQEQQSNQEQEKPKKAKKKGYAYAEGALQSLKITEREYKRRQKQNRR